ncbi:hypothetical protein [Picrophilus oshimae]|uniref:Uncharacterized protein n=1 Tax=Picrophilus torridus (strain ATCC 700027 / DSM 9790 / JCM 10055 / NBRC 100828 / KAW 2/3) TaxID=1122961 RepID=A0A8G2FXR7_PICTO|nr:hypothetical protein [Picrophilus oshimae]SMD31361.1 hypothetical protein SAMN02745355_1290 [Picrophilus oshimae DSM 9789]
MAVVPKRSIAPRTGFIYRKKRKHSSRQRFEPGYITRQSEKNKKEKENISNLRKKLNKCRNRMDCVKKVVKSSNLCFHNIGENSDRIYLKNGGYFYLYENRWFYHKKH